MSLATKTIPETRSSERWRKYGHPRNEVFGETATIWSQDDVHEFEHVAVKQNAIESDVQKFEFYVSGSNPENQCHLHIVPCEDTELALSMEITSYLRHSLQSRSEWKGVGQSVNHSCCKRHQNVELQFITVQAVQKDDDGNASPLSNQTWQQFYERNVKFSPANSLDTGILINQNTSKRSLNLSAAFTLACVRPMGKNQCSRGWQQHRNNLSWYNKLI